MHVGDVQPTRQMHASEYVFCPYCGEQFELLLDLSAGSFQMTTDCEVCCRPFEVIVETRDGGIAGVEVHE